ncbi:UNVERIFIED_CONTAM: hypothetical protein GTU68_020132 [Idotea baltica]|nr:hypothetical protein [Idotea baltica]
MAYSELLTVWSNIPNAFNCCPATYHSSEDDIDIISPNSFLKLHGNSSLKLKDKSDDTWVDHKGKDTLNDTLNKQEEAFEEFRRLWHEDYLLCLRELSRNLCQSHWSNRINVDDIVLIKFPIETRPFWRRRRI